MLLLLPHDGSADQRHQIVLRAAAADGVAERNFFVAEQANLQVPVGGDSQPVAGAAEVLRHGRDEPNLTFEARHVISLRCVVGSVGQRREIREAMQDHLHHVVVRQHLLCVPAVARERHVLDEAHVHRPLARPLDEVANFVLVKVRHHHAVHLRFVAELDRQVDAGDDALPAAPPRDFLELLRLQRVERDVQGVEAGSLVRDEVPRQHQPVCGDADILQARKFLKPRDDVYQILPDRRLAARQPNLLHALPDEESRDVNDLIGGQQMLLWGQRDALGGHAVIAAQVALLRQRYPQVRVVSTERVRQGRNLEWRKNFDQGHVRVRRFCINYDLVFCCLRVGFQLLVREGLGR